MSCALLDAIDFEDDFEFIENENNTSIKEIRPIVIKSIKNYFFNKKLYNGNKIDYSWFDLPYYSELVLKTDVTNGVLKAYRIIEENNFLDTDSEGQDIGEDIRYMLNLISNIQRFVPQEFVGGMILLHLEIVEGLQVW